MGLSLLLLAGTAGVWSGCEEDSAECSVHADCDDGIYCNGEEICVEGECGTQGAVQCGDDNVFCNGPEICNEELRSCDHTGDPCVGDPRTTCYEDDGWCGVGFDFVAWIEQEVAALPTTSSEGYGAPSAQELTTFAAAVEALLSGLIVQAREYASQVEYDLVEFADEGNENELLYGLIPADGNPGGRGFYFVRPSQAAVRELLVGAPHPGFETRSAVLVAEIFRQSGARGFAMAGAHRCANSTATPCDGTTTVCNSGISGPYRESDMAHQDQSFYQVFHELASEDRPGVTQVISLHGMSSDAGDPELTASDGTTADQADQTWLPNRFAAELGSRILAAGSAKPANSCNLAGDLNTLCGSTNTQGRFVNGVAAAAVCTQAAAAASGRFLHVELSYELRNPGGTLEPSLVVEAVLATIPTTP